jgi:hypothetical protein
LRALVLLLSLLPGLAFAQAQCTAPNLYSGAPQQTATYPMPDQEYPVWAISNYDGYGNPYIVLGASFFRLPEIMRAFTFMHECAHLVTRSPSEGQANCLALRVAREQGLTPEVEAEIAKFHYGLGLMPPQFGGSGKAYWEATVRCAGLRDDEVPAGEKPQ